MKKKALIEKLKASQVTKDEAVSVLKLLVNKGKISEEEALGARNAIAQLGEDKPKGILSKIKVSEKEKKLALETKLKTLEAELEKE